MKKIFLIVVILLTFKQAFSQDVEPTQHAFTKGTNTNYYVGTNNPDFQQNKFQCGPIWSGDHRSNYALGLNSVLITANTASSTQPSNYAPGTDIMAQVSGLSWHDYPTPITTISFQYEPALKITDDNFKTHDIDKAVFGFKYVDQNITTNLT